jgi:hypothetical protein
VEGDEGVYRVQNLEIDGFVPSRRLGGFCVHVVLDDFHQSDHQRSGVRSEVFGYKKVILMARIRF